MTDFIRMRGWESRQHYKDGRPIHWMRVDLGILDDYTFNNKLTEIQQAQVFKLWALAGRQNNKLENDAKWLQDRISSKHKIDLKLLNTLGFTAPYETVRTGTDTPYDIVSTDITDITNETDITKQTDITPDDNPTFWKSKNLTAEFKAFKKMRTSIKAPLNETGESRLIAKLAKMESEGIDIREAINRSIENCWKGVFPPDDKKPVRMNGGLPKDEHALTAFAKANNLPMARPGESLWDWRSRLEAAL